MKMFYLYFFLSLCRSHIDTIRARTHTHTHTHIVYIGCFSRCWMCFFIFFIAVLSIALQSERKVFYSHFHCWFFDDGNILRQASNCASHCLVWSMSLSLNSIWVLVWKRPNYVIKIIFFHFILNIYKLFGFFIHIQLWRSAGLDAAIIVAGDWRAKQIAWNRIICLMTLIWLYKSCCFFFWYYYSFQVFVDKWMHSLCQMQSYNLIWLFWSQFYASNFSKKNKCLL